MKAELLYACGLAAVATVTIGSVLALNASPSAERDARVMADEPFVNWETPHVHPIDVTPDGSRLLAVNLPDARLEIMSLAGGLPRVIGSVPVGLDPVSVRAFDNDTAWVVNHVSDSISVVDLNAQTVVRTIQTQDEPCDVAFAGPAGGEMAFVSCSQANVVHVFDPTTLGAHIAEIPIQGQDPRALAVSPDGLTVYAAIFQGGNRSTILGGGLTMGGGFPPNVVGNPLGPYGGTNPPPNDVAAFDPPINSELPPPPPVGLIVKQQGQGGAWIDDNAADWTPLVSGMGAGASGRVDGWTLLDHDVAIIDAASLSVTGYVGDLNNMNMALAVNPASGAVTVVGTDGTNETRFEPNLNGRFVRVQMSDFVGAGAPGTVDLNAGHLTYPSGPSFTPIAQSERNKSIGDPRCSRRSRAG
ncbi:MAG: YncE family protein, partial [Planctomycetota bacterium]